MKTVLIKIKNIFGIYNFICSRRSNMLKKINYVLDKRQKIHLCVLLVVIFGGAFVELLGVSGMMPIVNVAIDPECINEKWYLVTIRDVMGFTDASQMLVFLATLLIVVYIIKNIYITIMYDMQYRLVFNNQRRLAVKMMNCYMHQDYLFHVSKNVAELQRNVTADVNGFFTAVLNALQLVAEMSVCICLVVYLVTVDFTTTAIVATLIVVAGMIFTGIYKKVLVRKGEHNRELNVQVTKWILQAFSGIKEIKVLNKEKFFVKNYADNYEQFAALQRQQSMLRFLPRPFMESICICGLLLTVIIKIQFGNADIKEFIPILSAFAFAAFRMLPSFNRITGLIGGIMFDLPSINAVYHDLVEIEELMKRRKDEEIISEQIEFRDSVKMENISFHYPETEKLILDHADLIIKKDSSVALIGASGAGKTTAVDIILGLLEPQGGSVKVDGVDIRQEMASWHQSIGYIPQTIYLMDDTIRANIAFGIPHSEVDDKMVEQAMREAQLDQFVHSLPNGTDTIIGDRGVKLSGGQRQRIGIARALYRNPQVLILDEATSALDNETEKEVMEAIDGLHGQRTMIVIAHRLTTIRNCDEIYEVADGAITKKSHKEVFG